MRLYSKPINIYVFTRLIIKLYNIDTLLNDYMDILHRTIINFHFLFILKKLIYILALELKVHILEKHLSLDPILD